MEKQLFKVNMYKLLKEELSYIDMPKLQECRYHFNKKTGLELLSFSIFSSDGDTEYCFSVCNNFGKYISLSKSYLNLKTIPRYVVCKKQIPCKFSISLEDAFNDAFSYACKGGVFGEPLLECEHVLFRKEGN